MGSVSPMPSFFLVAASLFVISVVILVAMLWLGRRWLISPLRQLSKDVQELKAAESQSPLSPQVAADLQEITEPEVFGGPGNKWVGLEDAKGSTAPVAGQATNDLYEMCCLFDEQLAMSMGEVSFLAVLYDTRTQQIEIAYPPGRDGQAGSAAEDERLWSVLRARQALQETTPSGGSWVGVPIMTAGEVIGALAVHSDQLIGGFAETHQRLLSNLAHQAAIVLRGQRLATTYSHQTEQSLSLSSLTRRIWTSMDTDTILRTALEEIGHTFHASSGLIQLEYSFDDVDGQPGLTSSGAET